MSKVNNGSLIKEKKRYGMKLSKREMKRAIYEEEERKWKKRCNKVEEEGSGKGRYRKTYERVKGVKKS